MKITEILSEGASDVLFHITNLRSFMSMITRTGGFALTPALPDDSAISQTDIDLNKGKLFFMSFSRTRSSRYLTTYRRTTSDDTPVLLTVDGRLLRQNYRVVPVDYYQSEPNKRGSETEDRLISDTPEIYGIFKYVTMVEIVYGSETAPYIELLKTELPKDMPAYIYPSLRDMLIRNVKVRQNLHDYVTNSGPANVAYRKHKSVPKLDLLLALAKDVPLADWDHDTLGLAKSVVSRPLTDLVIKSYTLAVHEASDLLHYRSDVALLYRYARRSGDGSIAPLVIKLLNKLEIILNEN